MGVGDRHSKRAAADKHKASSPIQRSHAVDDRELDDPFSAWDDDDAGAQKLTHAHASGSSMTRTRIDRKPAAGMAPARPIPEAPPIIADGSSRRATLLDALVDPVAMRDIVISRARTLDDPLTTRVLAEVARKDALDEIALPRAQTRTTASAPDPSVAGSPRTRDTRDEISMARRRTQRRPAVARDDPFRKK
jgi:hypothetical protein